MSESVTRSPIELSWTAKNVNISKTYYFPDFSFFVSQDDAHYHNHQNAPITEYNFALYYALHYVLLYKVQYTIHFALHFTLHFALHYALHSTLNCSLYHLQFCIINNCWRSVPLPCGQYMTIFGLFLHKSCTYKLRELSGRSGRQKKTLGLEQQYPKILLIFF